MRKFFWASVIVITLAASSSAWQKEASFPDWKGYTDDTLAMNSMMSFMFWHGQGKVKVEVSGQVHSFRMFINGHPLDTSRMKPGGVYEADISSWTADGVNTLQVSNIEPLGLKDAVKISVPYPIVLAGRPEDEGINPESLALIGDIISSDIAHGFPGAQLAVIRNGRMVYSSAWGTTDTSTPDSPKVTRETLYDLASVTKVLAINFAVQKLVTDGRLDVDAKIADILGHGFLEGPSRAWKSSITVRDVMCHRAGNPAEVHYYDPANALFTGTTPSPETRAKTFRAILKTPLSYEPRTKILYSDVDFMLMCFVVEKVSGKPLDEYLAENFWRPMGLARVTFKPLEHGFLPDEIAATEIDGNTTTRGKKVYFPGLRDYVLKGEVHDEKAYHSMNGVSGHAGLFANAESAALLMSVMLTGGWGEHRFFSRNVIDTFTAPQDKAKGQWGLGWWREGDDGRLWYFGGQASSGAFGHQGFTGVLVMADPAKNLVIAYFTNKLNTPAVLPLSGKRTFEGSWFTASTLGFAAQILGVGMDSRESVTEQLRALREDMAAESLRLIPAGAKRGHPAVRNAESKIALLDDEGAAAKLREKLPK